MEQKRLEQTAWLPTPQRTAFSCVVFFFLIFKLAHKVLETTKLTKHSGILYCVFNF